MPSTTTYEGYDISLDLFPREPHRPSNVNFNLIDIKKPFTESMHGKFDVVYIRLIVSILQPTDWIMVAQNVFSILKPGGAIMWVELDASHLVRSVRGDTSAENPRSHGRVLASNFADLLQIMPWMLGGDMTRMTSTFAAAGFEKCEEDVVSTDRQPGEREFSSRLNLDDSIRQHMACLQRARVCLEIAQPSSIVCRRQRKRSRPALIVGRICIVQSGSNPNSQSCQYWRCRGAHVKRPPV